MFHFLRICVRFILFKIGEVACHQIEFLIFSFYISSVCNILNRLYNTLIKYLSTGDGERILLLVLYLMTSFNSYFKGYNIFSFQQILIRLYITELYIKTEFLFFISLIANIYDR